MKTRTAIFIIAVAAGLLLFILTLERHSLTTSEQDGRADRVFQNLRRDFVEQISISHPDGKSIDLARMAPAGPTGASRWHITSPQQLLAEASEVRAILSSLDYLVRLRTIRGAGVVGEAKYGFQSPRLACSFTARGETTHFLIGSDTPDGKLYLALENSQDEFYVVEKDILVALSHDLDDLRDPHLFQESIENAQEIVLTAQDQLREFKRPQNDAHFLIQKDGAWMMADPSAVGDLLYGLQELKALQFVADQIDETQFEEYGLIEPAQTATLTLDQRQLSLRIGGPCPDNDQHRFATVVGSGTVSCVGNEIIELFGRPIDRYLERRLLTIPADEIQRLVVEERGQKLDLSRRNGLWTAARNPKVTIDPQAVAEVLEALSTHRAEEIIAVAAPGGGSDRAAEITVRVFPQGALAPLTLVFSGHPQKTRAAVRRNGETAQLIVSADLLDLLGADLLRYRDRAIRHGSKTDVVSIAIDGPVRQKLVRKGDQWTITEPIEIAADGSAASTLAGLLTHLTVERYVIGNAPAAGFNPPAVRLVFERAIAAQHGDHLDRTGTEEVVLELGAKSPRGHRYGRFSDDDVIFELGDELEKVVSYPLIARDLLQLPATKITTLTLTAGRQSIRFQRRGHSWQSPSLQSFDAERLERLLADLGAIRTAGATAFGGNPRAIGKAQLTIVATLGPEPTGSESSTTTITVGARARDNRGYLTVTDQSDAIFVWPERLADELIDFISSSSP